MSALAGGIIGGVIGFVFGVMATILFLAMLCLADKSRKKDRKDLE